MLRALGIAFALAALLGLIGCGPSEKMKARAANLSAGEAFLAKNAKAPGVITLPSGLQYKVVRSGAADGRQPTRADEVKVHYEGKLLDGTVFDSSYERGVPASFPLNGLIPAWIEALPLMRPGDEWELYVPPALGYGERDKGPIPGNSVMVFRIELLDVLRAAPTPK